MPALPSQIVVGTLETAPPGTSLLFPFGDRDDPQRLAVLLAEHIAAAFPGSFAETTLKGLRRGHQQEQLQRIVAQKRSFLERFAPRALTVVANHE